MNNWTKESIILAIQKFYKINNKVPSAKDFTNTKNEYPGRTTVIKYFNSWNKSIEIAGFEPNISTTFSCPTKGLDEHKYRSKAEAYFCDNYLFNKVEYEIEPKYPNSSKRYDWYLPKLDLYIELTGGLKPETIKEKIIINKNLNRNCLFIKTKDIRKFKYLSDFS